MENFLFPFEVHNGNFEKGFNLNFPCDIDNTLI